jgi:hypothetical protein
MGRRDQERCVGGRSLVELTGDPRCSRRYRSVVIFMCSLSHPVWKGGPFPARTCQLPPSQRSAAGRYREAWARQIPLLHWARSLRKLCGIALRVVADVLPNASWHCASVLGVVFIFRPLIHIPG